MTNSNATVLRWNTSLEQQEYKRSFMQNFVSPLPVEQNQIPPFQLPRAKTGAAITSFKLVHVDSGTETTITSEIATAGLTVLEFTGKTYDLIKYPATALIPSVSFDLGAYYGVMSDGTNTWYSEVFQMVSSVSDMVKITWCHTEDFNYPGGHIDYGSNYQNYIYIKTDIGKPSYEYEEEIQSRDGYSFPEQQISFKRYFMEFWAGEFVIDALRLIRLHDVVTITNNRDGRTYDIDELLMNQPEWVDIGNVASVTLEFKTDTVALVNGRGVIDLSCGASSSSEGETLCVSVNYECVATIEEGGAEWTGQYYTPTGGGPNVPFVANDYIMVVPSGSPNYWHLYQFDGATYTQITESADSLAYDMDMERYYFLVGTPYTNWQQPELTYYINKDLLGAVSSPRKWSAYGETIPNTIIELYTYDELGNETLAGTGTPTGAAGTSIEMEFTWTESAVGVRAKISTATCSRFDTTNDLNFEGINYWEIPTDNQVQ